jgi:hypothetical protein
MMKMESVRSFETLVTIHLIALCHVPEDHHLKSTAAMTTNLTPHCLHFLLHHLFPVLGSFALVLHWDYKGNYSRHGSKLFLVQLMNKKPTFCVL